MLLEHPPAGRLHTNEIHLVVYGFGSAQANLLPIKLSRLYQSHGFRASKP